MDKALVLYRYFVINLAIHNLDLKETSDKYSFSGFLEVVQIYILDKKDMYKITESVCSTY